MPWLQDDFKDRVHRAFDAWQRANCDEGGHAGVPGGIPDTSIAERRVARGLVRDRHDWWMPVLFMRLKSGRLWYTPGESVDGKAYDQWPALIHVIQKQHCTPVLGPGLVEPILGSSRDLARRWAEKFKYPMAHHECE